MSTEIPGRRLSSRLTLLVRLAYAGIIVGLGVGALVGVLDGSAGIERAWVRFVTAATLGALLAIPLRLFAFVHVELADHTVIVRGLWRRWEFPASSIATVEESPYGQLFTIVRVTLAQRVPGLGRRFQFLTPALGLNSWSEAELLEVASRASQSGA